MSKATQKDELLAELAYLEQAEYIDKQACVQLVKIVEQHFSEPKKAAVKLMAVNTVVKMINAMPEEERTELKAKMFPDTQAGQSGESGVVCPICRGDGTVKSVKLLTQQPVQVDEEALAERLVNLSLSITEQTGDTQRFLKAKRFIEDNLTHSSTSGNDMSDGRRGGK